MTFNIIQFHKCQRKWYKVYLNPKSFRWDEILNLSIGTKFFVQLLAPADRNKDTATCLLPSILKWKDQINMVVVSGLTQALWKDTSLSPSYLGPYFTWSHSDNFFTCCIFFAAGFPVIWNYHFCWNNPLFLAEPQAQVSVWFGGSDSFFFFFLV